MKATCVLVSWVMTFNELSFFWPISNLLDLHYALVYWAKIHFIPDELNYTLVKNDSLAGVKMGKISP